MLQISIKTSPIRICESIKSLREKKGREKETLVLINDASKYGYDFIINLFWEKALTYQHMLMVDRSNKKALFEMEKTILDAKYWIEKYETTKWYSRLYRFLGRVSDYKGNFKNSISLYRKSIKFVNEDPEPFRVLELRGFLIFAQMMLGGVISGYNDARKLFDDFERLKIAKELKQKDYKTWAIWRSGVTVKTIKALLDNKHNLNKDEVNDWIVRTKLDLEKRNFAYRKAEINKLDIKVKKL